MLDFWIMTLPFYEGQPPYHAQPPTSINIYNILKRHSSAVGPCLSQANHLSCLSHRKTRRIWRVHLLCFQNCMLGTSTSLVPMLFFPWCKPKSSRDELGSQTTLLITSPLDNFMVHGIKPALMQWVPNVGLIILETLQRPIDCEIRVVLNWQEYDESRPYRAARTIGIAAPVYLLAIMTKVCWLAHGWRFKLNTFPITYRWLCKVRILSDVKPLRAQRACSNWAFCTFRALRMNNHVAQSN